MKSKRLITLLVLTTMLFAMVPMAPVSADLKTVTIYFDNLDHGTWEAQGEKGHDIEITSGGGAVASGYEVMLYWDKIQSWDGEKGHLNTTEADDDGSIEIWFKVPEADVGVHTLWFTATDQETKPSEEFTVVSDCDISTSSGLAGSKVVTDLWGFAKNKEVALLFLESDPAGTLVPYDYDAYTAWTLDDTELADVVPLQNDYEDVELRYYLADCDNIYIYDVAAGLATWDGSAWTVDGVVFKAVTGTTGNIIDITVDGTQVTGSVFYADYQVDIAVTVNEPAVDIYEAGENKYDGTLDNTMLQPGTVDFTIGGVVSITDDKSGIATPNGNLYWFGVVPPDPAAYHDVGNINFVSGEWSLDLGVVTGLTNGMVMDVTYVTIKDYANHIYILTSSGVTNSLGTYENKRVTIPGAVEAGQYYVVGLDGKNNRANDDFKIGATITLSTDEGDVGDKITVEGEGFIKNTELTCELKRGTKTWDVHIIDSEDASTGGKDEDFTNDEGEFEFDIIIPDTDKKDDDFKIRIYDTGCEATAGFEVTGIASISAEPEFGPQGSAITVSGENFQNIKDKKVDITLTKINGDHVTNIETGVKVDSDGSFEVDCTVPTENDGAYKIKVSSVADDDGDFYIDESKEFRIGTIMVLLSKGESLVGDRIVLTGNGFTLTGEWNATFGDITIFEDENCVAGLLKMGGVTPEFFVPQVQPGEYTILVWDVDAEISVETDFTVTEYTVLDFELLDAPNEFNVSISGWNWPEVISGGLNEEDEIEFVLWNDTDKWDMSVTQYGPKVTPPEDNPKLRPKETAALNKTGFLNDAWWIVPDDDTLDKGTYWVNATIETDNGQEYFMQLEFVIGDIHMYSAPRKATFRITETVSFKLQHTFGNDPNHDIKSGDIKVYDPVGRMYWDGDKLETWSKVETWYESPTSSQMASSNPMILLDDAPIGTWTYKWRDKTGEVIAEGTFNVESSEAEVFGKQIEDLNQAIDDLTDDITGVTDAVAGVQTNVQSAIQAANAAVDAANKAIEAVNAVAGTASEAAEAANKAAEAAGKAQESASGLTTLVYGAIGASLVAALAAIVSLMQISKRIAG